MLTAVTIFATIFSLRSEFNEFLSFSKKLLYRFDNVVSITYQVYKTEEKISNKLSDRIVESETTSLYYKGILHHIKNNNKITGGKNFLEYKMSKKITMGLREGEIICLDKYLQIFCTVINDKDLSVYKKYSYIGNIENNRHETLKILNMFMENCKDIYVESLSDFTNKHYIIKYNNLDEHIYNEFICSKNIVTNLHIENKDKLITYVDQFNSKSKNVESNEKYDQVGYTHKAIMMFYGNPGTGKTSTIKAILNRTKRHGVYINFSLVKSQEDFDEIFNNTLYLNKKISIDKLCFIFEDVDAHTNSDVLFKREFVKVIDESEILKDFKNQNQNMRPVNKSIEKTPLSLSGILNMLDGVIELKDLMVIFTTNHIHKFDEALLRPGRIDFTMELKYPTKELVFEILCNCYKIQLNELLKYDNINNIQDREKSSALIQSICFTHENIQDAINKILEK